MNAPTTFPPLPDPADDDAPLRRYPPIRHDGWTPDRQRIFLELIADGHTVEAACRGVGLSPAAAYAFRRRAGGAAFALGWRAANLLARDHVADTLLARAIDGQTETITRPDGATIQRHRYDNRLAGAMLARLDREAEAEGVAAHHATRLVAGEFDAFLDLLARDGGPLRAGLFLAARADPAADLDPVAALARADRFRRAGGALPHEVDCADLDPADRACWTAEQWTRAEAAGLVALAPAPAPTPDPASPELPPLRPDPDDAEAAGIDPASHPDPVWWCPDDDEWRTRFPPPDGFLGHEEGEFGDPDYERSLSPDEEAIVDQPLAIARAVAHIHAARDRDAWFAAYRENTRPHAEDDPAPESAPDPAPRPAPEPAPASKQPIRADPTLW